jgi:hypothetical protein
LAPEAEATAATKIRAGTWTTMSMISARIRLGKRATVRSSTTASPVTTSVTASSGSDRIAGIDGQVQDYPVTEFW